MVNTHPRPSGRGPIEALCSVSTCTAGSTPIRDLAVAAPLKHLIVDVPNKHAGRHPRPSGRGPIEARQRAEMTPLMYRPSAT